MPVNNKTSKTTPKKSVVISKKTVKSPIAKTGKGIEVKHKVVYTKKPIQQPVKPNTTTPSVNQQPTNVAKPQTPVVTKPAVTSTQTVQPQVNPQNKTYTTNQSQPSPTNVTKTTQVQQTPNSPKPKKKKKKHRVLEAITAVALFGTVLGGIGYHVYNLIQDSLKEKEEYKREVESATPQDVTASGKQNNDTYEITLSTTDKEKEVVSIASIKIGDTEVDPSNYTFDKDSQKVTFKIEFLKQYEGKIVIATSSDYIPVIKIEEISEYIEEDSSLIINVTKLDHLKEGDEVKWKSSNEEVATVTGDDKRCTVTIKPFKEETKPDTKSVRITASLSVSGKSASCTITVNRQKVKAILSYHGFNIDDKEEKDISKIVYYKVECDNKDKCETAFIPATYHQDGEDPKPVTGFYMYYVLESSSDYGGFRDCEKLTSVDFEDNNNIKQIQDMAFFNCFALNSFKSTKLNRLESIGRLAFGYCNSLKSFVVPKSVKFLNGRFFDRYSQMVLTSLSFEDKINTIWYLDKHEETKEYDTKDKTPETLAKEFYESDSEYSWTKKVDEDAILNYQGYNEKGFVSTEPSEIVYYKVHVGNPDRRLVKTATIPAFHPDYPEKPIVGFYHISGDDCGFYNCINLETLKFEENSNLEIINDSSFRNCKSLKEIDLTPLSKLETIHSSTFRGCINLENIKLPSSIKHIWDSCFADCPNLKRLNSNTDYECNLPSSIYRLGHNTFAIQDSALGKVGSTPFNKVIFNNTSSNFLLYSNTFGDYDETKTDIFTTSNDCYYLKKDDKPYIFCGILPGSSTINVNIAEGCVITASQSIKNCNSITINFPSSLETISYNTFADVNSINASFTDTTSTWDIYGQSKYNYDESIECGTFDPAVKPSEVNKYLLGDNSRYFKWLKNK